MSEKRTVNIITKWDNVINLDGNVNKFVKCQMCGEMINENIAIYKEDEGYYCSSCNERIYRNSETEKLKEQIKNLEEIIVTLKQKLNAYEEVYGDITD